MTRKLIFLAAILLIAGSPIFAQTPGGGGATDLQSAFRLSRHGHRFRPLRPGTRKGGGFGG